MKFVANQILWQDPAIMFRRMYETFDVPITPWLSLIKWLLNKILLQKIFLLSINGVLAYEILMGYLDYNNQVVEYMESMSYRQARESSRMKDNRELFPRNDAKSSRDQCATSTENEPTSPRF